MEVKKIFFDMDGVLSNFDKGILELCHTIPYKQGTRTKAEDDALWQKVKAVDNFYYKLDMIDGSKELFDFVYNKYKNKCEILTGIPKARHGILTSKEDKIKWCNDYLNKEVIVNVCYREEKILKCTGKDCILIDDYEKNIKEWEEAGGTGILFVDSDSTISKLKELNIL